MSSRVFAASMAVLLAGAVAACGQSKGPVVNPLTDTSVYPIAVWAMGAGTAPAFSEMGVNIFVGGEGGDAKAWADKIAKSNCMGFVHWQGLSDEARRAVAASPGFLGWMHGDEPDNPGADGKGEYHATMIMPEVLIGRYEAMKKSSTPAPMYLNLGLGLAVGSKQSTPDSLYYEFMKCADVVCYDVYPVSTIPDGANRLHLVARGVERLRRFAGPDKPVWVWLECTRLNGDKSDIGNRAPRPHELRAEIWMAILYGASGIGYFPHQFNPYRGGPRSIPAELQTEMKLTNRLLHKAAPILRSGRKTTLKVEAGSGHVAAAAWRKDGELLVVAVNMRNKPARATIQIPAAVKRLKVVGQNYSLRPRNGALVEEFKPYEVRLYTTGPALTRQHYGYPAPKPSAQAAGPRKVTIDFEGDLPKGTAIRGQARITEARKHGGSKALALGPMGEVTIPLTKQDFRGRVTMWVYDSSKKHGADDANKPAVGPTWGLQDSRGRMMLFGIIRRSFLSQNSYSYIFTSRLRGYPSPGHAGSSRVTPGWHQWEFDLTEPGRIVVRVNGKETNSIGKNYANFDKGFNAIKIVGGGKGEFEEIVIDDIRVEYPAPRVEKPGRLTDLPAIRDNRKGILWSRTHKTRLAVPVLAAAPTIDGDYSDAAWDGAETLASWSNIAGTSMPTYETTGLVGRQGGKLYFAFRCTEDFMKDLVTDKKAPWQNDCIEIFLDPDNRRTSGAHIIVTAGGRVEASRLVPDQWGEGRRDDGWQPAIKAATGRWKRGWTVEMSIDLKDLGDIGKNPVWAFDVARERKPKPGENSVYTIGGFNNGFRFGEMTFQPAKVTLANGTLTNRTDQETDATVEILVSAPEPGQWFPDWEARWFDLARETVTIKLAPGEKFRLINHQLSLKIPAGGRLRLTLKAPKPELAEEFIANPWGGVAKK